VPWSALLPVLRTQGLVADLSGASAAAADATPSPSLGPTPNPLETAAAFQTPEP
jgi:hypothetical protein